MTRSASAFLARVEAGQVGDPADPETEVGPLVNERRWRTCSARSSAAARRAAACWPAAGAATTTPTSSPPPCSRTSPTTRCSPARRSSARSRRSTASATLDEAIARANAVEFGLSAALFTRDLPPRSSSSTGREAGILHVNSQTAGADVHVPFGGVKGSGFGPHEQGRAAREFYTEVVTVYQEL